MRDQDQRRLSSAGAPAGTGPIAFAGGKKKKLVFRLGKRRSHILRHGGKIQIWIDATLGRATTKRFVHVTRVASVSLSP